MDDVYQKHFKFGGLTLPQVVKLYNDFKVREIETWKNNARIMGAKFDEDAQIPKGDDVNKIQPGDTPMTFGEPEAYQHLTEKERREMTQRMIAGHKQLHASLPDFS